MVHPGIPAITVLVENNVGRAMTYQSDVVPADLLHLIVITFDADASSNNCKAYLNGTLMSASGATSTQVYSSADGSNLPEIFKFQSNSDPKAVFHGEMIIGNQLPDSTELAALTSYFTGKYGSFPKPL